MRRTLVALTALLDLPSALAGQTATAGAVLQTYSFAEALQIDQVQLLLLPVAVGWTGSGVSLGVEAAWADGIVTLPGGGSAELSGPVDTRVAVGFGTRALSITTFATLPTGDASYTPLEMMLLGTLASDLLPFGVEAWGAGGSYGGEATASVRTGATVLTVGGGYVVAREYTPFEGLDDSYRPGGQTRAKAMIQSRLGVRVRTSLLVGLQRWETDRFADAELFRAGTRIEAVGSLAYALGARESVSVHAAVYERNGSALPTVVQIAEPLLPGLVGTGSRRLMTVGAELQLTRDRLLVLPDVELRTLSAEDGVGDGWLASAGLTLDHRLQGGRLGRRLVVAPRARMHLGSVSAVPGSSSIFGWELGLALRWEAGR